jgi:hypothetical protein
MQAGLVLLRREDPVRAAFGQMADVVTLAMQRVGRHDHPAQVADLVE